MSDFAQRRFSVGLLVTLALTSPALLAAPQVITLTQLPCQFLQSEDGHDRGYRSTSADECKQINAATGEQRVANATPLTLKAGDYIFRVTNKNVPYSLGFWLRGDGLLARATLPSVSGGGLETGTTLDYRIHLTPGEYRYSCPLNPTPDYKLVVTP